MGQSSPILVYFPDTTKWAQFSDTILIVRPMKVLKKTIKTVIVMHNYCFYAQFK